MNSHSVRTTLEPVFEQRMPSYSENISPARLLQPQCTPDFMGRQYDEAYFFYKAQEKDTTAFPAPWSTEGSVVDSRSPVTHLSGIDRRHIYRKDSKSEEIHPNHKISPTNQSFTLYSKSPGSNSPQATASVIVRNDQATGERLIADRPMYVTLPQALYRHSPCCTDLCCVMGHGSPSLSNPVYDHGWKPMEPAEVLLQQRRLHTERMSLCSPEQTLPAVVDQTYNSTKVKEIRHSLQCSPRAFPGLYPSQPTYESVIYHNHSPISKYGQAPQHPVYYYSPTNVEVERRTENKNSGSKHTQEIPVGLKHPIPPPPIRYMATSSLPRIDTTPNPAYLPEFEYPSYLVPRLSLQSSPIHTHLKHPLSVHSNYIHMSPKQLHHSIVTLPSIHRDKSALHADHTLPFAGAEQTSPTTFSRTCSIPKSSAESLNGYGPPRHSDNLGSPPGRIPGAPPSVLTPEHLSLNMQLPRHHAYHVPPYPKHPPISPTHTILSNKTNNQKIMYHPPVSVLRKNVPIKPQLPFIQKRPLKRHLSTSSPIKIADEDDVFVSETDLKRPRTEHFKDDRRNKEASPPMPVINNVFSLAPYQAYVQLAKIRLDAVHSRPVHKGSEQSQTQMSNEHVRQQTELCKDDVADRAPEQEVSKTLPTKHLDGCRAIISHPPSLKVTIKQEILDSSQQCSQFAKSPAELKVKQESPDEPLNTCAAKITASSLDLPNEESNREQASTKIGKKEPDDQIDQRSSCSELSEFPEQLKIIKTEPEEIDQPDNERMFEVKKCEPEFEYNEDPKPDSESGQRLSPREDTPKHSPAPSDQNGKISYHNIPPQCLKLSTYNIILPKVNLPRTVQICDNKSPAQPLPLPPLPVLSAMSSIPLKTPVRKHFLVLHQSLMKLISKSVAATSEETLKSWLSRMELNHHVSGKNQKVSCLFGEKGSEACLNEEMKSSLQQVVERLNEYTAQEHCPFPFVLRTRAIFLPMLVVKEVLFPSVHGALIDQALQAHKVELRPTTLSEEKTIVQMHKRPCSSRLRRLMSIKHLPDVYTDVVNLFYYTCVCQQLGIKLDYILDTDESCARPSSSTSTSSSSSCSSGCDCTCTCSSSSSSSSSNSSHSNAGKGPSFPRPASPHKDRNQLETKLVLRKSRITKMSRRFFLDSLSEEDQQTNTTKNSAPQPSQLKDGSHKNDNSWMCPLASEGDIQGETSVIHLNLKPSFERTYQEKPKSTPGVILKLRRINRERKCYRPVLDSERLHIETEKPHTELSQRFSHGDDQKRPEIVRLRRTSLRMQNALSKQKLRSLAIKYCPYLSTCHSSDYRRRWVLRSAVQRARRAMKIYFPDLVGRRIQHLYEEVDKSEVWYKGDVLSVHKTNPNPLKTVFEVRYDSEPEWRYYLELLIDYKKGWLKIDD